jgi:hypothetical protein
MEGTKGRLVQRAVALNALRCLAGFAQKPIDLLALSGVALGVVIYLLIQCKTS